MQLYHQLSGRAGRTGRPSTVYFQTYNTNQKMISDITNKNPDIFLEKEIEIRKRNNLTFSKIYFFDFDSENENKLEKSH